MSLRRAVRPRRPNRFRWDSLLRKLSSDTGWTVAQIAELTLQQVDLFARSRVPTLADRPGVSIPVKSLAEARRVARQLAERNHGDQTRER